MASFGKYTGVVERVDTILQIGRIERIEGLLIEGRGPRAFIGEQCRIINPRARHPVPAEVVGAHGGRVQIMPYAETDGIEVGQAIVASGRPLSIPVSPTLKGRVLDSLGRPIDDKGGIVAAELLSCLPNRLGPLQRSEIESQLETGIRAIDAFVPIGKGQRMGIFSGSGIGKSILLGMIARNTSADVNVIALIGERGREVREFIRDNLGQEGLARSVLVVSTSDTPPMSRLQGAFTAATIAEYFRDRGNDVMLLFDSITRFARAQREIGLAIGEPPATRGFPPSVFSLLPRLLERCGSTGRGSITGCYNILVEGDDLDEPISDTARGILDGHIVLSRRLAQRNHYPAVDVLASLSRLTTVITDPELQEMAGSIRRIMALYADSEDLINVGAYQQGTNPAIDAAIALMPKIDRFLQQRLTERSDLEQTNAALRALATG